MNKAEYKGEIYNIETIYVYDEYISIYNGNLLETESIKVALSEVKILPMQRVNKRSELFCVKRHEFDKCERFKYHINGCNFCDIKAK
jgi:hypothetical protein